MSKITVGRKIPNFKARIAEDTDIKISDYQGKHVVLYFYPRDNTPGCTQESQEFRDTKAKFTRQNAVIIGISRDTLKSHDKFKDKYNLNFDLIADPDETLCELFGVMVNKNMYGKKVRSIERSTFLIDENGVLQQEWRKVKVDGHVDEVLAAVKSLQKHGTLIEN